MIEVFIKGCRSDNFKQSNSKNLLKLNFVDDTKCFIYEWSCEILSENLNCASQVLLHLVISDLVPQGALAFDKVPLLSNMFVGSEIKFSKLNSLMQRIAAGNLDMMEKSKNGMKEHFLSINVNQSTSFFKPINTDVVD